MQKSTALLPAFIQLPMQLAVANSHAASSNICVEIQYPRGAGKVNWPTESAVACATFLHKRSMNPTFFFQLLKRERIKRKIYSTRKDARSDMFVYIEMFYNVKRRHDFNNQLSPIEF